MWEKLDTLKRMDDEILELVDSDKVNGEIEQADEIKGNIYSVLVQLDDILSPIALHLPQLLRPPLPALIITSHQQKTRYGSQRSPCNHLTEI